MIFWTLLGKKSKLETSFSVTTKNNARQAIQMHLMEKIQSLLQELAVKIKALFKQLDSQ